MASQIRETGHAQNALGLRVDRVDDSRVMAVNQIADHGVSHRTDFAGRTDDGNRLRKEQRSQVTSRRQREGRET